MLKGPSGTNWEFERFKVMTEMRLLIAGGTPVPLTPKAFDTLVILIENRDRVVTKDELLSSVWPDVQVEEGNLTQQIFLLRKALGETAQQPRYIVTIPGHGYRFTARVSAISNDPAATAMPSNGAVSSAVAPRRGATFIATALVAVGLITLGLKWMSLEKAVRQDFTRHITKITESGKASGSAISQDGRYVAYVENDGDEFSLWVKRVGTEGRTLIVPRQPFALAHLTFSPDGESLYFARGAPWRGVPMFLSRVPVNSGPETPLLDDVDTPVSFSPDGRQFAFTRGSGRGTHIVLADAGGGSQRILATREGSQGFELAAPGWSPDGKMVAAAASDTSDGARWSIVLLPIAGGNSRELFSTDSRIGSVRWLPDGSGLLTVISETLARQTPAWDPNLLNFITGGTIWRVGYPSGRAERLTSDLTEYNLCCLDVSANGTTITSVINSFTSDLRIAEADHLDAARQITWGNPVVTRHGWLPDNDTIAFRDLSGRLSTVDKVGRVFNLALSDGQKVTGGVSVCGDGRYIVFQAVPGNGIWRIPPNAGGPVKLTSGLDDSNPACSPDGKWVMYSSARSGSQRLWRVPIDGGESAPLVQDESYDALPSPSGRLIYYAGIEWVERPVRVPRGRWTVISSTDRKVLFNLAQPSLAGLRPNWAPDESGLDYVVTRNGVSNIWRQPLTGGAPVQITRFNWGRIFSFAWSPDRRWLSLGSGISRSDVVLMSSER